MIKSDNTASVSSLCCTNTRHFPEAPLLPEQEGSAGNYTPDELRNAEEMLADLDEVYYSLIKLQREYGALVRASGPDGYVCHSAECSRSAQSLNMSALELAQRLECLSSRYHALVYMLRTLKEDLAALRPGREYTFLKLPLPARAYRGRSGTAASLLPPQLLPHPHARPERRMQFPFQNAAGTTRALLRARHGAAPLQ